MYTNDGVAIRPGDHVWNFYDREWGIVGRPAFDGWFEFTPDGANYAKLLNGDRVMSYQPVDPYAR